MSLINSILGATVGKFFGDRAYWGAKLSDGSWRCELDERHEIRTASMRPFDWTLDMVDTGDVLKIKELWLFCPPTPLSPLGNTARLPIKEPGTALQFKVGNLFEMGAVGRNVAGRIIGRVDNKETGECTCFIWDEELRVMSAPWRSNVYNFGSWRDGIAPQGRLNLDTLGVRL